MSRKSIRDDQKLSVRIQVMLTAMEAAEVILKAGDEKRTPSSWIRKNLPIGENK